jgi:hypothetical protein
MYVKKNTEQPHDDHMKTNNTKLSTFGLHRQ